MSDNTNFYSYETDFLLSDDVTAYYNWRDPVGFLKKDGKLYYHNINGLTCAGDAKTLESEVPSYRNSIEGIPEKTYLAWVRKSCGDRAGHALICFRGLWRIAMRLEIPLYKDTCRLSEACMKYHFGEMSKEDKYGDFIFIYSGTDRNKRWPPQKIRTWVLLPERLYEDEHLFAHDRDLRYSIMVRDCRQSPNCRFMLSQRNSTDVD